MSLKLFFILDQFLSRQRLSYACLLVMRKSWLLGSLTCLLLVGSNCVTTKKRSDVSSGKRFYHNLTSKYNYWFNANELMRATLLKMEEQHHDNYNQLLEIYPYMAVDPQPTKGDFDNVIKKCAAAISLHRQGDWTDDCYLMVGQAQYLKHDFETAEKTFKFIQEEYGAKSKKAKSKKASTSKKKNAKKKKPAKKKKKRNVRKKKKKTSARAKRKAAKKKEKAKAAEAAKKAKAEQDKKVASAIAAATPPPVDAGPDPYKGRGRRAIYPTAMVWYVRTLVDREKYDEADFMIRELQEDPHFNRDERTDLSIAEAYLWYKQKRYDRAIAPLAQAIQGVDSKKERARLAFLLAQLYNKAGQFEQAYATLETVSRSNPPYELDFNAQLMQIRAGWLNGGLKSGEAVQKLEKLAKDAKNHDYRDQIYFTMAEIALADRQQADAIGYLRESLRYSKSNTTQKSEAYLKLADLYFEDEDFVKAKLYYDSTSYVLPNTDERYARVSEYAANLTDIARLITTIHTNDSLISVYNMTDAQRKDLARTIKKQRREAEAAAERATAAAAKADATGPTTNPVAGVRTSWYFYNEALTKRARREFERNWGTRSLEDNWRRSQRIRDGSAGVDESKGTVATTDELSDNDLQDIFAGVPRSKEEVQALHATTYDAMYNLGRAYRDKLQNNRRSVNTLEELLQRYRDSVRYEKETWYYAYLGHTDLRNAPQAKVYYDKLIDKYPNSVFARTLSDPNFIAQNREKELALSRYYDETFAFFQKGQYETALERCTEGSARFGTTNPLMPKFTLLKTMCIGKLKGNDAYCEALNTLMGQYPESAEATRAREIARVVNCKGFEVAPTDAGSSAKPEETLGADPYVREDDKVHFFIVVLRGDNYKLEDVKNAISDYNREFHALDALKLSTMFLGTDMNTPLLVLRKFDNFEKANAYYKEVLGRPKFLGETESKKYSKESFIVTQENYRGILKAKSLDGYRTFFKSKYPN